MKRADREENKISPQHVNGGEQRILPASPQHGIIIQEWQYNFFRMFEITAKYTDTIILRTTKYFEVLIILHCGIHFGTKFNSLITLN
jgi:hypothetical protein